MSSPIQDLQQEAYNPSVSVLDLLRKALIVATKLNITELQEWIELELKGYQDQPIPDYRKVAGTIRGWNQYHGWQPIVGHDEYTLALYTTACSPSIRQSISELVALIDSGENGLHLQLSPELESVLIATVDAPIKISISSASIKRIVESVRDVILRWSVKLEKDGIIGEGINFTQQEKQIAGKHDYSSFIQINVGQSQMQNSSSESQSNSDTFNNDLRGSNIGNFANQVKDNARQVSSDFSQNIGQNSDEIIKIITSLREMAQEFPEEKREEIMVHLEDLEEDITKPEKLKPQRIKARIMSLLTISGMLFNVVAGAADFSNNVLDLSEKLGVPIERTLFN
ncbi:hypothetical protein FJR38_00100 [Anabaena sp. UHCC 0253]|uniref:AbiTii domain-containing protein n=1 Tax=Anabaena sp. UHCC 0253 TaxID=2590019 RepID=UPI001447DB45|nr:hypothetical protein [Anabaena sp. UHCC 0253]MTJ51200.1 hypothetical protein [Anabaena sp. UHCC 0253]